MLKFRFLIVFENYKSLHGKRKYINKFIASREACYGGVGECQEQGLNPSKPI